MDAAALLDSCIPFLDTLALVEEIKAGLSVVPLSSRELDLSLQVSPSPRFPLSPSGLLLMDLRVCAPG